MNNDGTKRSTLWVAKGLGRAEGFQVETGVLLRADGTPGFDWNGADPRVVSIQLVEPLNGVVAVAFVGEQVNELVALAGTPLGAGMHLVRTTERIDVGDNSYWLSEDLSPQRTTYDPAIHEPGKRCRVTKAPLKEGQEIVICPGVIGVRCDVIYQTAVWDTLLQENASSMKCHNCGYRPGQPQWRPPEPKGRREPLHELCHISQD